MSIAIKDFGRELYHVDCSRLIRVTLTLTRIWVVSVLCSAIPRRTCFHIGAVYDWRDFSSKIRRAQESL